KSDFFSRQLFVMLFVYLIALPMRRNDSRGIEWRLLSVHDILQCQLRCTDPRPRHELDSRAFQDVNRFIPFPGPQKIERLQKVDVSMAVLRLERQSVGSKTRPAVRVKDRTDRQRVVHDLMLFGDWRELEEITD